MIWTACMQDNTGYVFKDKLLLASLRDHGVIETPHIIGLELGEREYQVNIFEGVFSFGGVTEQVEETASIDGLEAIAGVVRSKEVSGNQTRTRTVGHKIGLKGLVNGNPFEAYYLISAETGVHQYVRTPRSDD